MREDEVANSGDRKRIADALSRIDLLLGEGRSPPPPFNKKDGIRTAMSAEREVTGHFFWEAYEMDKD